MEDTISLATTESGEQILMRFPAGCSGSVFIVGDPTVDTVTLDVTETEYTDMRTDVTTNSISDDTIKTKAIL